MSEHCPLSERGQGIPFDIPEVCERRCGAIYEAVTRERPGEYDDYLRGEEIPDGEIQYSHSAIGASALQGRTDNRFYTVVDECVVDTVPIEIGETTWTFQCPYA